MASEFRAPIPSAESEVREMEFSRGELENLLEFILREMTGKETSVAVLGDEISVNVEGKQTSFCVGP